MRHAARICLPTLLIAALGVMGSGAAGASQKASNGLTRSKNVVVRQSPRAGKRMSAGSKVRLVVSRG